MTSDKNARRSIPVLDEAIPAAGGNLGGLHGMPYAANGDAVMRFEAAESLAGLPVPHPHLALAIA